MNKRHVYIVIFTVLFFIFLSYRESLAQYAWIKYGNAGAAIFLTSNAQLVMQIGDHFFNRGGYDLDRAEKAFRKAVRLEPDIPMGHYQLARIYFVKGETERALEEINLEITLNQWNLRSFYIRGLIYGYGKRFEAAENDFRRFIEWTPKEWAGYNDLAWILAERGKYTDAAETINKAFEEIPEARENNPWLWNSLGVAYLNLEAYTKAEEAFLKAEKIAVSMPLAEWLRAYPGNDSDNALKGLENFKFAIEANLKKSRIVEKSL